MILAERAAHAEAEAVAARAQIGAASAKAEAANAQADLSSREELIAHLKVEISRAPL
jgi:transposase